MKANGDHIQVEHTADNLLTLKGALTFASVLSLWQRKNQLFARAKVLHLDLAGVERTDSAGLAFLLSMLREAEYRDIELYFLNVPQQLIDIAHLSGLEAILPINYHSHDATIDFD